MIPTGTTSQQPLTPFEQAVKHAAALAEDLQLELLLDTTAVRMGEPLTLDEMTDKARAVARAYLPILAVIVRICCRCDHPLQSPCERVTGFCETCRAEFQARVDLAKAGVQ